VTSTLLPPSALFGPILPGQGPAYRGDMTEPAELAVRAGKKYVPTRYLYLASPYLTLPHLPTCRCTCEPLDLLPMLPGT
jgi:hypothetical protein